LRRSDPSIPSRADLVGRLNVIASQGYALAQSTHVYGIDAVSAPILGTARRIAAALTIAGPAERCTLERLQAWLPDLMDAADEVSQVLDQSVPAT
jgi:DNA-binding IclR family transcriptional regulator